MGFEIPPELHILLAEEIMSIRLVLGGEISEADILRALAVAGNNPDRAINVLLDAPQPPSSSGNIAMKVKTGIESGIEKAEVCIVSSPSKDPIFVPGKKDETLMWLEKDRVSDLDFDQDEQSREKKESSEESCDNFSMLMTAHYSPHLNARPVRALPPVSLRTKPVSDRRIQAVPNPHPVETGEFPEEVDWFLLGKSYVMGLSTARGRNKLEANEIVYFNFPKVYERRPRGGRWVSSKAAAATSEIVRFSTKRSGELGKLPLEWSQCLIPLVQSSKVKVCGRCALAPIELSIMKEITLYVSFYINSSAFTWGDKSSWNLEASSHNATLQPLHNLFYLLNLKSFKEADFTPEELDSRKRSLNLRDHAPEQIEGLAKRRKGNTTYLEQGDDDQAITESSLNKLVGTAEVYNLQEAEPPSTLLSNLWSYQKQALYWMTELEKGIDVEQANKTLHPCWSAYNICDKRTPTVYLNVFSGEAATQFPSATQMTRGGILADAMGLGKTVMTIALILANPSKSAYIHDADMEDWNGLEEVLNNGLPKIKGGTLIVCPMALLGQWKDELEAHAKPGSMSVFVHYGGEKSDNLREISKYHVVLTTYGVLTSAYKTGSEKRSVFHNIRWYRIVLDEAHTIKCSKTRVA